MYKLSVILMLLGLIIGESIMTSAMSVSRLKRQSDDDESENDDLESRYGNEGWRHNRRRGHRHPNIGQFPELNQQGQNQIPGSWQNQFPGSGQNQFPGSWQNQFPGSGQNQFPGSWQNQFPGQGQNQFPGQGQNQFPGQEQNQFPGQGQNQFPGQGQNQFPGQGQNQFPGQGQNQFPGQGQNQFPGQGQNQFPGQGQNQFPGQGQNQFPGQGQNQFPGQGQNQFPGQGRPNGVTTTTQSNSVRDCVRTCPVTSEYNPVCGTDNVTYENPGRLACAQDCGINVGLQRAARCPATTTVAPSS